MADEAKLHDRKSPFPRNQQDDQSKLYGLNWPRSRRWNPQYNVPRNSLDTAQSSASFHAKESDYIDYQFSTEKKQAGGGSGRDDRNAGNLQTLSSLTHWLETLAELYMNDLDNRARWDPRWISVTHPERYAGLKSASVTILDYPTDQKHPVKRETISGKQELASALQSPSDEVSARVILVTDLSRFVMGAIGQTYAMDPEFWFEHLTNSGYASSDSQLKVSNAVWLRWTEEEIRFRHRPLPGPGQMTEWNHPRRSRGRCWTHLRWGRLGLMHYLGRKGFYESEIEKRLGDERWLMERDVQLDKHGLLMTERRQAKANKSRKERQKKGKWRASDDKTRSRVKATNVHRPYTTFESLPKNISSWFNRDLRVMAPEGASYWSGQDAGGRQITVLVLDPHRGMRHSVTEELTPSITFMPRAMEIDSYTEEEMWRTAEVGETFLDPPPAPFSKETLKKEKAEARKNKLKGIKHLGKGTNQTGMAKPGPKPEPDTFDASSIRESARSDVSSVSSYESDDEFDEEYEEKLREEYTDPKQYSRDRDFARKYSLTTHDLMCRYFEQMTAEDLKHDPSMVSSTISRVVLDDFWQLLAEMRLELDHLDSDLSGSLYEQMVDFIGNTKRQDLTWMTATLQELHEWLSHIQQASAGILRLDQELVSEGNLLKTQLESLQARAQQTLATFTATMALAQSTLVIDQTSGINKVTELAFFFVPVSFITSCFSMQVLEIVNAPPHVWTWGLSLSLVIVVTYLIRGTLRSPSVRAGMLRVRATINSRFSSTKAGSASRRFNTVSNRAIIKFAFFFTCVMSLIFFFFFLQLLLYILVFGLLWMGTLATATYFIVVRWPEPAALIPCFISIPISLFGWYLSWSWMDWITDGIEGWILSILEASKALFPPEWLLDKVSDEDLAKEGVQTFARQAIIMAT